MEPQPLSADVLPRGVRSRFVEGVNGLTMHLLEAGFEQPGRPSVLLLHGFPELAYSWRRVLPALAAAGYHAIAPDQRGYGRTTGWDARYDGDLRSFRMLNLVRDAVGLLAALSIDRVKAVVGHDFGSPVAAWCALLRPDVFRSVVLMSAPFAGPPPIDVVAAVAAARLVEMNRQLSALRWPRQHYQWYYTTRQANLDLWRCEQGVHAFLRAYYHHKSADWKDNHPHPLRAWSATELAHMPTYYVMERGQTMAQTVAVEMPGEAEIAACQWLPEGELAVYSAEYERTGFQGGLQWYRCAADASSITELQIFSGRTIDVPALFIAGASDWGVFQKPGDFEAMQTAACTRMLGCELVDGAGHWVQQEQATTVNRLLLDFLQAAA
ncbi:MAG TPA: alpha/beta fold hydrolase [Burkholderiaceae bacterium]|nr:alpha/beta fold hydrolase [Burkholderiaceae bacterium]